MLEDAPALARHDLFVACACGESAFVADLLAQNPGLARAKGGPDQREAILYACFSRLLRRDAQRARGIVRCVQTLIAHGADPNAHFFMEEHQIQVCLYGAAGIANDPQLTQLLLEAGADVNELYPPPSAGELRGTEALYHASEFRDLRCLRLLLEAKPYPTWLSYCLGRMLDFDNEPGALLYLEHGADPNLRVPWNQNRTHLHKAAMNGRSVATVSALLDCGGDPDALDARGLSPYRYAIRLGHQALVALFEAQGADRSSATQDDRDCGALARGERVAPRAGFVPDPDLLQLAIKRGDLAALRVLVAAGAELDSGGELPPLHWAAYFGQAGAVTLLIDAGARLDSRNAYGGTALGAAQFGSLHCSDPEGGLGDLPPSHGDYARVAELLIAAGVALPQRAEEGSEAVLAVLHQHGVPSPSR
jgi:ankyrin repeat protein